MVARYPNQFFAFSWQNYCWHRKCIRNSKLNFIKGICKPDQRFSKFWPLRLAKWRKNTFFYNFLCFSFEKNGWDLLETNKSCFLKHFLFRNRINFCLKMASFAVFPHCNHKEMRKSESWQYWKIKKHFLGSFVNKHSFEY